MSVNSGGMKLKDEVAWLPACQDVFPDALFEEAGMPPPKRLKSSGDLKLRLDEIVEYKRKTGVPKHHFLRLLVSRTAIVSLKRCGTRVALSFCKPEHTTRNIALPAGRAKPIHFRPLRSRAQDGADEKLDGSCC